MRRIAIIGSGQNGLLAAHGFLQAGHAVTVYSDRSAEQWLRDSKPTGTAGRFALTLEFERSLGLNYWDAELQPVAGPHVTLCLQPRNSLVTVTGRLAAPGWMIDVRLQSHRWMNDLEARGGRVVVEQVDVQGLDRIAAEHDLTIVAVGKADLARIFARDAARSVYDAPKRKLAMAIVTSPRKGFPGVPFVPVKFDILANAGEVFLAPIFHKDHGRCWTFLVEAVPGGPLDRFQDAGSGDDVIAITDRLMREIFPWDADFLDGVQLADPHGWLTGAITPVVRSPVARLPSGRVVGGLGDTIMTLDPVGGQGANNGNKMARHLVESVAARGDGPLDEAFLTETFERYYARHGKHIYAFNNTFLEPPSEALKTLLICQYGSDGVSNDGRQKLADAFSDNFNDPAMLTDTILDLGKTRELITRTLGVPWWVAMARGGVGVAAAQLRQKLGRPPGHPQAEAR